MNLTERKLAIVENISALNALIGKPDAVKADVDKKLETIQEEIKNLNGDKMRETFTGLAKTSEPVKNAIIQLNFDIVKLKATKDKDTDLVTYSLEDAKKQIELLKFAEFVAKSEFAEENWRFKVEKFNQLITFKAVKDLNGKMEEIKKSFYISKLADAVEMGKTPTSNTQVLKNLQTVVDAIIYEEKDGKADVNMYKAKSHDAEYIIKLMCKRGDSGKVVMPKVATMHTLIMDVLHRIVLDLDYKIEYTKRKDVEDGTVNPEVETVEEQTAQPVEPEVENA